MRTTMYFVVPAPGHYGDSACVWSSHFDLSRARRAAGATGCVRVGAKRRGARWLRVYEETYPLAEAAD